MSIRALELDCEHTIIQAAKVLGYRVHGERAAFSRGKFSTPIKGHPGWPDLFIVGHHKAYAVELKRQPRRPDVHQCAWIGALAAAGIDSRILWVPEGMQGFIDELAENTRGKATNDI